MSLLLDTHILLWVAFESRRLSRAARDQIGDPSNTLWFSVASIWEVSIKRSLNRADFKVEPATLRAGLLSNGYRELAIEGRHCLQLSALATLHADPFDRMLIAQATVEGMTLLTADKMVGRYGGPTRLV